VTAHNSNAQDEGSGADRDFQCLVEACYLPLYRFALSLTRSETDAGDLVQETFHIWARKGHQLQDRAKARSWLFTTLHRLFLQTQRRQARFPHLDLEDARQELPVVDADWVNGLDAGKVLELLGRVDPPFQAPVALFYLEDSSYEEIGRILGVPLGTVKSRIARGLVQLKRLVLEQTRGGTVLPAPPRAP
jgi:RNA polymerase sigma-70 factor (ECF subfamily)